MNDDWRKDAACLGTDVGLFFPEPNVPISGSVKALCQSCRVRQDCLLTALHENIKHGVWGGLSVKARRAEKRKLKMQGVHFAPETDDQEDQ